VRCEGRPGGLLNAWAVLSAESNLRLRSPVTEGLLDGVVIVRGHPAIVREWRPIFRLG
jgi:hypothetical protein